MAPLGADVLTGLAIRIRLLPSADGLAANSRAAPTIDSFTPRLLPTHDRRELAAIFTGGILGSLVRTGLSQAFPVTVGSWPWATFAVNVVGAFMLGYFVTRLQERLPTSAYKRPFLGTGVCGALTTFSTVQVELYRMVQGARWGLAIGYAAATVVTSFLALAGATALVRRVRIVA